MKDTCNLYRHVRDSAPHEVTEYCVLTVIYVPDRFNTLPCAL